MNSGTPKVSVIVPLYNVIEYIDQTIHSLVNQTLDNIELILIDDGSKDGTNERALQFEKDYSNLKVISMEINQGVSVARNIGLREAKGDYIFFMDSDDLLLQDSLETMYYAAVNNKADLTTGIHASYIEGKIVQEEMFTQFPELKIEGRKELYKNTELFYLIYCWGKLYKRELVQNIKFPEGINYYEDQPFMVHAYINAKKIYTIPTVTYYHRKRSGASKSLTQLIHNNPEKNLSDLISVIDMSITLIVNNKNGDEKRILISGYLNRVLLWNLWNIINIALNSRNSNVIVSCINTINDWITTLDNNIVSNTSGFQIILKETSKYAKFLDADSLNQLLVLMNTTKDKIQLANMQQTNLTQIKKITLQDSTKINVFENDFIGKIIDETKTYYEIDELQSFEQYLPKNGVIYDIGTNIGNHTLYFSKYLTPKKIYSFEPILAVCDVLEKNLNENNIQNVEVIKAAVSNKNTKGDMNINRGNIGGSQLNYNENGQIQVVKLDDMTLEEPDFVKIDVEDFELDVIDGMENTLLKSHPLLWIEIRDKNLAKVNYKLMLLGYKMLAQIPSKYDYSNYIYH